MLWNRQEKKKCARSNTRLAQRRKKNCEIKKQRKGQQSNNKIKHTEENIKCSNADKGKMKRRESAKEKENRKKKGFCDRRNS